MEQNHNLKVLDLSWNNMGSGANKKLSLQLINTLGNVLKDEKKSLVHLDISFNNFSKDEAYKLQYYLTLNKSLFGFHF